MIDSALCVSYKRELALALHNHTAGTGHAFKLALLAAEAGVAGTYGILTENYSEMAADEVVGDGYTAGGVALTMNTPDDDGETAFWGPSADAVWEDATFIAGGCMAYNHTNGDRAWFVFDFASDEEVVAGTFTIAMPINDADHAVTRI